DSFKTVRDGVVFTNKRIISVNVKGVTGSKKNYTSLPYKNIVIFSVETSGTFDIDAELSLVFSHVGTINFEFTGQTSVSEIANT
ncbi:PH domain-containing protein, partial [Escherichia coli]|uniref:PH domain-containing protein n=1 Tax=Escherichia coli TaxID=562 RepID=UPI00135E4141